VNPDYSTVLGLDAGLNPWLVILLSSIVGLLTFALCNALYVLHIRHKNAARKRRGPFAVRCRYTIGAASVAALFLWLVLAAPGPKLVEGRGWLAGDDLFAVSSRSGFVAGYPSSARKVDKGDVILQLIRDAGPEELAAAATRRALLVQDVEFARLETLRVDPLLLAAHATEKDAFDDLLERRRALVENQESLLRGVRRQELADQARLDEVEQELQAARYELDQTDSSFKIATVSLEVTDQSEFRGLFAGDEVRRREERVAVLRSRREELRERIELLGREQRRLRTLTAASDETHAEHMTTRGAEMSELDAEVQAARERVDRAWQDIEQDKVRAERQRDYRVRQVELQIAELDQLLDAREGALEVRAPWDALVGFREPSPASARFSNRPLLVLYKPGSISVKLQVPADRALLDGGDDYAIDLKALIPEAASSTFVGKVTHGSRLPDGSGELQIVGDPPEAAIRDLATGTSVPAHVVIRRLNPLAAAQVGWVWWGLLALAFGFAFSEAKLWRTRVLERRGDGSDTLRPARSGIDWGGNPDEFLEYVVGVGIVSRKLRRAAPTGEHVEERRGQREPAATSASVKVKGSAG
jgi:hypothetical protein